MNTEQKLTKIREKCVELLAIAEKLGDLYGGDAIAAWESTIAAIDMLRRHDWCDGRVAIEITEAWEGLV